MPIWLFSIRTYTKICMSWCLNWLASTLTHTICKVYGRKLPQWFRLPQSTAAAISHYNSVTQNAFFDFLATFCRTINVAHCKFIWFFSSCDVYYLILWVSATFGFQHASHIRIQKEELSWRVIEKKKLFCWNKCGGLKVSDNSLDTPLFFVIHEMK